MTAPAHPQQEYIITEEQLNRLEKYGINPDTGEFVKQIRSRPHTSVQSRDQVLDEVAELMGMPSGKVMMDTLKSLRTLGSRDP